MPPNSTGAMGWATSGTAPTLTRSLEDEHAVPALLRLSREYEGELTLIALGPLTNIARRRPPRPRLSGAHQKICFHGRHHRRARQHPHRHRRIQYLHRSRGGLYHAGRFPALDHAQLGDDPGARLPLGQIQSALRHRHRQRALLQGDFAGHGRAAATRFPPARVLCCPIRWRWRLRCSRG